MASARSVVARALGITAVSLGVAAGAWAAVGVPARAVGVTGRSRDLSPGGASSPAPVLHQTISVRVIGGTLSVSPTTLTVELRRARGNHFTGTFGPITVTDGRGTLSGWRASVWSAASGKGTLMVHAGSPTAISGLQNEVDGAPPSDLSDGQSATIMRAPSGGGGGTFSVGGAVELSNGPTKGPDAITVTLSVGVA